jgi:transcription-repair coupling factor (superfamily II helicase)
MLFTMRRSSLSSLSCLLLLACGQESEVLVAPPAPPGVEEKIAECRQRIAPALAINKALAQRYENDRISALSNQRDRTYASERASFYAQQAGLGYEWESYTAWQRAKSNRRNWLDFDCDYTLNALQQHEQRLDAAIREVEKVTGVLPLRSAAQERMEAMTELAELDKAERKKLADMRKKAVSYSRTAPDSGVQVERFEFKGGRVVLCTTKVGSMGPIVTCSE